MKRLCILLFMISACTSESEKSSIRQHAEDFFEHYKTREDWQAFQDLYAADMIFEDVIFRMELTKPDFIEFYNWPDTSLKKHPDYPEVLVLEDLALTDTTAIGRGYFNQFYYKGKLYGDKDPMRFTMALHFNDEGKITRHIDFIEYAPEFLVGLAERFIKEREAIF